MLSIYLKNHMRYTQFESQVAICIPYYHGENYIYSLLESIKIQKSNFNLKVYIYNDDPGDSGFEKLSAKYNDQRFIFKTNNVRLGAHKNVINLYKNCREPIIIHMDQDDAFTSSFDVETLVSTLCGQREVSSVLADSDNKENVNCENITFSDIVLRNEGVPHSGHTFWRRDLELELLPKFWIDLDAYRLLNQKGRLVRHNSVKIVVRKSNSSLSRNVNFTLIVIYMRIIMNLLYTLRDPGTIKRIYLIVIHMNAILKTSVKVLIKWLH